MSEIQVSYLIVNWNRTGDVLRLLERLGRLVREDQEVVVVDNGSVDDPAGRLKAVGWIKLICAGSNLGPARARNLGIRAAAGRYIMFLDSDAMPSRLATGRLVARIERDPGLDIVGCRIVDPATRRIDQWIYHRPPAARPGPEFETYSFSAAGAIARADALRAVGGFWDDLFIYNEEVELSIRILREGGRILYLHDAVVFHRTDRRGRSPAGLDLYWYYQSRNWIWLFYRHFPPAARYPMALAYVLIYMLKGIWNRRPVSCLRGLVDGLRRTDLIGGYPDKLSRAELRNLWRLNPRWSPGRLLSGPGRPASPPRRGWLSPGRG